MANFQPGVLTTLGAALNAKVEAAQTLLRFTKVSTSSHQYADGDDLTALTALDSPEQDGEISLITIENSTEVEVNSIILNTDVTTAYPVWTLGLFATDPDVGEILYMVIRAVPPADTMPAGSGAGSNSGAVIRAKILIAVNDATQVDTTVSLESPVTNEALENAVSTIRAEIEKQIDGWKIYSEVGAVSSSFLPETYYLTNVLSAMSNKSFLFQSQTVANPNLPGTGIGQLNVTKRDANSISLVFYSRSTTTNTFEKYSAVANLSWSTRLSDWQSSNFVIDPAPIYNGNDVTAGDNYPYYLVVQPNDEPFPIDTNFTLQFMPIYAFSPGKVLRLRDENQQWVDFEILGVDGKPLPDGAWSAQVLITLQVLGGQRKCFFNKGGAASIVQSDLTSDWAVVAANGHPFSTSYNINSVAFANNRFILAAINSSNNGLYAVNVDVPNGDWELFLNPGIPPVVAENVMIGYLNHYYYFLTDRANGARFLYWINTFDNTNGSWSGTLGVFTALQRSVQTLDAVVGLYSPDDGSFVKSIVSFSGGRVTNAQTAMYGVFGNIEMFIEDFSSFEYGLGSYALMQRVDPEAYTEIPGNGMTSAQRLLITSNLFDFQWVDIKINSNNQTFDLVANNYAPRELCYGNGRFVAVLDNYTSANADTVLAYSYDLLNWKLVTDAGFENITFKNCEIIFSHQKFLLTNPNSTIGYISDDGINWQQFEVAEFKTEIIVPAKHILVSGHGTVAHLSEERGELSMAGDPSVYNLPTSDMIATDRQTLDADGNIVVSSRKTPFYEVSGSHFDYMRGYFREENPLTAGQVRYRARGVARIEGGFIFITDDITSLYAIYDGSDEVITLDCWPAALAAKAGGFTSIAAYGSLVIVGVYGGNYDDYTVLVSEDNGDSWEYKAIPISADYSSLTYTETTFVRFAGGEFFLFPPYTDFRSTWPMRVIHARKPTDWNDFLAKMKTATFANTFQLNTNPRVLFCQSRWTFQGNPRANIVASTSDFSIFTSATRNSGGFTFSKNGYLFTMYLDSPTNFQTTGSYDGGINWFSSLGFQGSGVEWWYKVYPDFYDVSGASKDGEIDVDYFLRMGLSGMHNMAIGETDSYIVEDSAQFWVDGIADTPKVYRGRGIPAANEADIISNRLAIISHKYGGLVARQGTIMTALSPSYNATTNPYVNWYFNSVNPRIIRARPFVYPRYDWRSYVVSDTAISTVVTGITAPLAISPKNDFLAVPTLGRVDAIHFFKIEDDPSGAGLPTIGRTPYGFNYDGLFCIAFGFGYSPTTPQRYYAISMEYVENGDVQISQFTINRENNSLTTPTQSTVRTNQLPPITGRVNDSLFMSVGDSLYVIGGIANSRNVIFTTVHIFEGAKSVTSFTTEDADATNAPVLSASPNKEKIAIFAGNRLSLMKIGISGTVQSDVSFSNPVKDNLEPKAVIWISDEEIVAIKSSDSMRTNIRYKIVQSGTTTTITMVGETHGGSPIITDLASVSPDGKMLVAGEFSSINTGDWFLGEILDEGIPVGTFSPEYLGENMPCKSGVWFNGDKPAVMTFSDGTTSTRLKFFGEPGSLILE